MPQGNRNPNVGMPQENGNPDCGMSQENRNESVGMPQENVNAGEMSLENGNTGGGMPPVGRDSRKYESSIYNLFVPSLTLVSEQFKNHGLEPIVFLAV
ncbi:hypothetical protein CEXT_787881 [Caerostris extrusa]|uniref:Uncharacterized protein n=1 Tax=Caerostris extrusa TaxID=172846 RepID=A0AAV4P5V1_CAEEX|nr:hypothetical protein CEXT_787881 [Caerostris extrusa]